jgi:endoglucanase
VAIPPLLDELLRAAGPPGAEGAPTAIVRREAARFAEVSGDVSGSTTAVVHGTAGGPLLAVFTHVDEIGLAVSHVEDDGQLAVLRLASWRAERAVGQRIEILAGDRRVPGVVARRVREGELEWPGIYVDVGATSRDEALGLVTPGDPAVLVGPPVELAGGRAMSKSLDNRASVFAALEALRRLAAEPPACDVALVATVQEEGSGLGAQTSAFRLAPDVALVVDVTWATDVPAADVRLHGSHALGSGAAVMRGSPSVHPVVARLLLDAARAQAIEHTIEVAKETHTDADEVHRAGAGVPTGVVSIPLRYMHSASELVQLSDIDACSRLIEAFARRLEPGLDLMR